MVPHCHQVTLQLQEAALHGWQRPYGWHMHAPQRAAVESFDHLIYRKKLSPCSFTSPRAQNSSNKPLQKLSFSGMALVARAGALALQQPAAAPAGCTQRLR